MVCFSCYTFKSCIPLIQIQRNNKWFVRDLNFKWFFLKIHYKPHKRCTQNLLDILDNGHWTPLMCMCVFLYVLPCSHLQNHQSKLWRLSTNLWGATDLCGSYRVITLLHRECILFNNFNGQQTHRTCIICASILFIISLNREIFCSPCLFKSMIYRSIGNELRNVCMHASVAINGQDSNSYRAIVNENKNAVEQTRDGVPLIMNLWIWMAWHVRAIYLQNWEYTIKKWDIDANSACTLSVQRLCCTYEDGFSSEYLNGC